MEEPDTLQHSQHKHRKEQASGDGWHLFTMEEFLQLKPVLYRRILWRDTEKNLSYNSQQANIGRPKGTFQKGKWPGLQASYSPDYTHLQSFLRTFSHSWKGVATPTVLHPFTLEKHKRKKLKQIEELGWYTYNKPPAENRLRQPQDRQPRSCFLFERYNHTLKFFAIRKLPLHVYRKLQVVAGCNNCKTQCAHACNNSWLQ